MKKFLALSLAMIMSVAALTGCGGSSEETTENNTAETTETETATDTETRENTETTQPAENTESGDVPAES